MWNLEKNGADELICKAEMETQMYTTNLWLPSGGREVGMNWEIGIDIYTLLCIKAVTNEHLLVVQGSLLSALW